MNRKDFLKMCAILGIGVPAQAALFGCNKDAHLSSDFDGKVIIIGGGPGGLSAAYFLHQYGVEFELLEATSQIGGRMKINKYFADFPIPLGAEWLETDVGVLKEMVNDASVQVDVKTVSDDPDYKFVNSSWFNFFETYIIPSITDKIKYDTVVESIDYESDKIIVKSKTDEHIADAVIVAVPLKVLQDGDIQFSPALPSEKTKAIGAADIWDGFKAFFEFKENFYGDGHEFDITPKSDGEQIYYNAAHGQKTDKNILGLFVVGKPVELYNSKSGDVLRDYILQELDGLYNNKATTNYMQHIVQDWSKEPYVRSGYLSDHEDWKLVKKLGTSVSNKIYFAGGAYTDGEDWVSVHVAAQSAKTAVEEIAK
ncbi:MAG: monoamine oxidase [Bacteroidia bacterium]|jgi:monoamine oxidase